MAEIIVGSEAVASGVVTRGKLRWNYRAIFPDVYVPCTAQLTLRDRTIAAWLWSGRRAVIAGRAAAALHGARWVDEPVVGDGNLVTAQVPKDLPEFCRAIIAALRER